MDKKSIQTTLHMVAYVDLLGTTKRIEHSDNNDDLNYIYKAIEYVLNFKFDSHKCTFIQEFNKKLKIKTFSDNILFAIPIDIEDRLSALMAMIKITSLVQSYLLLNGDWLSRGAITCGELYIDENFVWGKALTKAYTLESYIADYPRVIIDPDLMRYYTHPSQLCSLNLLKGFGISKDFDDCFYVILTNAILDKTNIIDKLTNLYEIEFRKFQIGEYNNRTWQKYSWLKNTYLIQNKDT